MKLQAHERKSSGQIQLAVLRYMARDVGAWYRSVQLATAAWPTHRMTAQASTLAISKQLRFLARKKWIERHIDRDGFTVYRILGAGVEVAGLTNG